MRTIIASLLIAVLVASLGAGAVIYAGWYNVAATAPHWRMTSQLLKVARIRSIKAQAAGIAVSYQNGRAYYTLVLGAE